ncbi:molybdate ABC transporter permease subunit [Bacillus canaveralius]|uniref:Molybdenum transport system permease n=1 Tax=Bacillus canaveralius TaxID=1403243 RepID=A0A2N5GIK1_9BACI|nr:molybdate ABC transporter permease subunit [Bacillus canaveralius]PLR80813.1 molybdate ABC transporter permease subunit [Bacillus canaveralius]PLR98310.1 molybdate ABC transporter permease subunit [Bacillus canaveralius]
MINEQFWIPIKLSMQVACTSLLIVLLLGLVLAKVFAGKNFQGKVILETILMLPLVLPPTVIGFLLIIIFGNNSPIGAFIESILQQSVMFTATAAVIASAVVAFPLMYQSAKTGFQSVDIGIEEAARIDGASEWKVFLLVTIPLSVKAIVSGAILSFARGLGEFGATLMFAGNIPGKTQTVPTAIYVALESGNIDLAWLWVASMVIISFIMLLLTQIIK